MKRRVFAVPGMPAALAAAIAAVGLAGGPAPARDAVRPLTAWALATDERSVEGPVDREAIALAVDGRTRRLALRDVLSVSAAAPASPGEAGRITAGLAAVAGTNRAASEAAGAELADIGLPVMTPLLAAYKDTDAREPNRLYHLFARIVPGYADGPERGLDLVRMGNGETLRGELKPEAMTVRGGANAVAIAAGELRRLAIRQQEVRSEFDIQALRHSTPVEFLDTGIRVTPQTRLTISAAGFVRLSFGVDGWASDPDGLKKPGPNYATNLVDGFPFGALVGRIGPAGPRWLAGKHVVKSDLGEGRLYLAVNDNAHWQNNIGSFRVTVRATEAYSLGDPE